MSDDSISGASSSWDSHRAASFDRQASFTLRNSMDEPPFSLNVSEVVRGQATPVEAQHLSLPPIRPPHHQVTRSAGSVQVDPSPYGVPLPAVTSATPQSSVTARSGSLDLEEGLRVLTEEGKDTRRADPMNTPPPSPAASPATGSHTRSRWSMVD